MGGGHKAAAALCGRLLDEGAERASQQRGQVVELTLPSGAMCDVVNHGSNEACV
jgi:hypothetical protein